MSSTPYYLEKNFKNNTLTKSELKSILNFHKVQYSPIAGRSELLSLFCKKVRDTHKERMKAGDAEGSSPPKLVSTGPDDIIDSDGFRVPKVPRHRLGRSFNAEDSFGSSEDESSSSSGKQKGRATGSVSSSSSAPSAAQSASISGSSDPQSSKAAPRRFGWLPKRYDEPNQVEGSLLSSDDESTRPSNLRSSGSQPIEQSSPPTLQRESSMYYSPPPLRRVSSIAIPLPPDFVVYSRQSSPSQTTHNEGHEPEMDSDTENVVDLGEGSLEDSNSEDGGSVHEDSSDDSDYYPDDSSDDYSSDDEEDYEEKIKDIELYHLYIENNPQAREKDTKSEKVSAFSQITSRCLTSFRRCLFAFMALYIFIFCVMAILKHKNGYCDERSSETDEQENKTTSTKLLNYLPSSCVPCPSRGNCKNGILACKGALVSRRPFYNIGGILPIPEVCVLSTETEAHIRGLERLIKRMLSKRQGQLVYREYKAHSNGKQTRPLNLAFVDFNQLKNYLYDIIAEGTDAFEATEILKEAMARVVESPQFFVWNRNNAQVIGTSKALLPKKYYCVMLYRFLFSTYARYVIFLLFSSGAVFVATKIYTYRRSNRIRIQSLVDRTIADLSTLNENHLLFRSQYPSNSIPVLESRSRLIDVFDPQSVNDWEVAVKIVSKHPKVRLSTQEFLGEPTLWWEFIPTSV